MYNFSKIRGMVILAGFLIIFGNLAFADQIHELAQNGDLEGVKALIEKDPELVNAKDKDGRAPLHWACRGVHLEVVKLLVDKEADVNAEDSNKIVPLHSLAVRNSAAAIEILIGKGLDINLKDNYGWTPLHYAARDGRVEAVGWMVAKGADIETRTVMGQSPLNVADEMKHDKVRALLIAKGAEDKPTPFCPFSRRWRGRCSVFCA